MSDTTTHAEVASEEPCGGDHRPLNPAIYTDEAYTNTLCTNCTRPLAEHYSEKSCSHGTYVKFLCTGRRP